MSQFPLITVLLPCYNAMPFLTEALDSMIGQTYQNLEILCINDGSTDNTAEILAEYAHRDSRIRIVHNEKNIRLIQSLNKGVSLAQGKYIARMDADDVSALDRIEKLYHFLVESDTDIVSCNYDYINEHGKVIAKNELKCLSEKGIVMGSYFFTPIGHALLLGKKDCFVKYEYIDSATTLHCEDYELWSRMIRDGVRMRNLNENLYSVRSHNLSVSRKYEEIQVNNFTVSAHDHYQQSFGKIIPYDLYAVIVNRFESIELKDAVKAFKFIGALTDLFLKQTENDTAEKKELKNIALFQKTEILVQILKKSNLKMKAWSIMQLVKISVFQVFNTKFFNYLFSKFYKYKI